MTYDIPTSLDVGGKEYAIRSDYRAILDICIVLNDPELPEWRRVYDAMYIFYPDYESIPESDQEEALRQCFWFINGGKEDSNTKKSPQLVSWEQDFPLIVAPVNRVLGREIRAMEYLHWWSFLSAYMEIGGDCTFAQVVGIRDKQSRGKSLDKSEKEWLRRNRDIVDIKKKYTHEENELLKQWT